MKMFGKFEKIQVKFVGKILILVWKGREIVVNVIQIE